MKKINEIDKQAGQKLRNLRKLKNFSQDKLGKRIGVTFQQVQKYESGVNRISTSTLYKIADALNVGVEELLPKNERNRSVMFSQQELELIAIIKTNKINLTNLINFLKGIRWSKMSKDLIDLKFRILKNYLDFQIIYLKAKIEINKLKNKRGIKWKN